MYLKDIIADEYKAWQPGTEVIISAPTGMGKTTFVLKTLLPYALQQNVEILYLSNRTALNQDLIKTICDMQDVPYEMVKHENLAQFQGITFMTYQTLQEIIGSESNYNKIPFYHYVVADEIHYITCDSDFSAQVQRFYGWYMACEYPVKIAISATVEETLPYLLPETEERYHVYSHEYLDIYLRKPRYLANYVTGNPEYIYMYKVRPFATTYKVFIYDDLGDILEKINSDKTDYKWIVFTSNKENIRKNFMKDLIWGASLVSADNKDGETMQCIVENNYFKEKILITTKVLDNGVSLHDCNIRNIVLETTSRTDFLQMLGRRRFAPDDETVLNIFIPRFSVGYFTGILEKNIKPALKLFEQPKEQVLKTALYSEDGWRLVKRFYDVSKGELKLNLIAKSEMQQKLDYFETTISRMLQNPNAFVEEQLSWLCYATIQSITDLRVECKVAAMSSLMTVLKTYELSNTSAMDKAHQIEFRKQLKPCLEKLLPDKFSENRLPGLHLINEALEELEIQYRVISNNGKKKGELTTWQLQEMIT